MNWGNTSDPTAVIGGGPSPYMKDLVERLSYIKSDVLCQFNVAEVNQDW